MTVTAAAVFSQLRLAANPAKAKLLARFFRTGPGEYGEGDIFLGIMVPESRRIAVRNKDLPLSEVRKLLSSPFHEARLVALLILVHGFQAGNAATRKNIYHFYLSQSARVNNWDLVDLSAGKIIGGYLAGRDRKILLKLARSKNLWERRIAIVATSAFIARGEYRNTFQIAEMLLRDPHDLIHKATGWMLREVGKRCGEKILEKFLEKHVHRMPRTMLRYAIERLPEKKRLWYLKQGSS